MDDWTPVGVTVAQLAQVTLLIAQDGGSMLFVEPTNKRDYLAVRRAGDDAPTWFVDRDGLTYSRMPFRVDAA